MPVQGKSIELPTLSNFMKIWSCLLPLICIHGGRGGGKSIFLAMWLIAQACIRENQTVISARQHLNSIEDSNHATIVDMLYILGLNDEFEIHKNRLKHKYSGTSIIHRGVDRNIGSIRSTLNLGAIGLDECNEVTFDAYRQIVPTFTRPKLRRNQAEQLRNPISQLMTSFNPRDIYEPSYQIWVAEGDELEDTCKWALAWREMSLVIEHNDTDNEYINTREKAPEWWRMRDALYDSDPQEAEHVYGGKPFYQDNRLVYQYKKHWFITDGLDHEWQDGRDYEIVYGIDFGSRHPTVVVEVVCYTRDDGTDVAYVRRELAQSDLNEKDMPGWMTSFFGDTIKERIMMADSAARSAIQSLEDNGFRIEPATEAKKDVDDSIRHTKNRQIYVHRECPLLIKGMRQLSRKVHKSGRILIAIDKEGNEGIDDAPDALRYALSWDQQPQPSSEFYALGTSMTGFASPADMQASQFM